MSDNENGGAAADKTETTDVRVAGGFKFVTLLAGTTYNSRATVFKRGEPKKVDAAFADFLATKTVDVQSTVDDQIEVTTKPRFLVSDSEELPKEAPRRRRSR